MRSSWFALSLCLFVCLVLTAPVAAEPSPASIWMTDFSTAQAEAKKLNRPIVVHVHAKWCGPCKQMERELLHTAQVLKALEAGFVAVKVDVDWNASFQAKYRIAVMPTDLILTPDGKVLERSEGYDAGTRQKYLASIARIDARYAADRQRIARTDAATESAGKGEKKGAIARETRPISELPPTITANTGDKLVPPPVEPKKVADAAVPAQPAEIVRDEKTHDVPAAREAGEFLLAMEGYCPVTLRKTRTWKAGSSAISLKHDGQLFYFTAAEQRDEFKADPAHFAPRLLGCDPVVLAENDLAVRGSVKFGAFYEGELFLFESADSRAKFRKDPVHYARLQHVLKPEDVKKIAAASIK